ncbi:kinesin-2 [Thecamonas trahens ATCC 50062]|uniref:Kinesin-2 n=1 Tax=Thecamonas trahens ATCC 50062 TaxID=461836 RepID=A0A0L0DKU0_THETB|nr:kinesin-2 [Thecamonas trahens ATCC 50062]KNC52927.1 kinesin-2 [Thecamonas trahens ATCC 50062]|eukprot:XP_013754822.1 kinesin-2 [Thecamonas trahens ATCC 50062]
MSEVADKENTPNVMLTTTTMATTTAKRRFGWSPSKAATNTTMANNENTVMTKASGDDTADFAVHTDNVVDDMASEEKDETGDAVVAMDEADDNAGVAKTGETLAQVASSLFPASFEAQVAEAMYPKFTKEMRYNMKKKLDRLGEYYRALKRNMQTMIDKKNAFVSEVAAREADIGRRADELAAIESTLRAEVQTAQGELAHVRGKLDAAESALATATAELDTANAKVASEAAAAAAARTELAALKDLLREAEVLVKSQTTELTELKHASALAEQEAAAAAAAAAAEMDSVKRAAADAAAASAASAAKDAAAAADKLAAAEASLADLKAQVAKAEASAADTAVSLEATRSHLASAQADAAAAAARAAQLEGANSALQSQLDANSAQLSAALASFNEAQAFNKERTAALTADKDRLEAELVSAKATVATLEARAAELETQLAAANADAAANATALEAVRAELTQLEASTTAAQAEFEAKIVDLEAAAAAAAAELASLGEAKAMLETSLEDAELNAATTAAERDEARAAAAELNAAAATAAAEKAQLEANLAETKAELETTALELATFKANCGVSSEEQLQNLVQVTKERDSLLEKVADRDAVAAQLAEAQERIAHLAALVHSGEAVRRTLHNRIQELRGTIRVVARVRPLLSGDSDEAHASGVNFRFGLDKLSLELKDSQHRFAFDQVFGESASQSEVFDEVANFVQSALDGYSVNLFAYGQTGSGKTHTMQGEVTGDGRGIIPRAIAHIMTEVDRLADQGWAYTMKATFVEIYNETIRDLLRDPSTPMDALPKIGIRHGDGITTLIGANDAIVSSAADIVGLMERANENRSVAATSMNAHSSRSHSVFSLHLTGVNAESGEALQGVLNLCDLAGSERLAKSKATGDRLKETQAINKSLSALSDIFVALSSNSSHVPYRNSKLTYLLQNAFAGQGKSLMIVNLSPSIDSRGESLCSLRFASKVHNTDLGKAKKHVAAAPGAKRTRPSTALGVRTANGSSPPKRRKTLRR